MAAWTLTLRLRFGSQVAMTRGLKPFDLVLSPIRVSPLEKRPPEMKSRVFLEVVVATAGGQLELAEVVARLAEDGLLLDVVGQVGIVGRIGREAVAQIGNVDTRCDDVQERRRLKRVIAGRRQPLGIDAIDVGIEAADDPLERPVAGRRQPQFLGPLLEVGGVAEVRGQKRRRSDRRISAGK